MKSEELRTKILKEYELGLINENELSSLLMDFAMKYHAEQCNITDVVFNEAENCPKCLKPKRMKPNTIQMLCECINSEVELCEHPFALVMSKCNGEINHCLKCGEHF